MWCEIALRRYRFLKKKNEEVWQDPEALFTLTELEELETDDRKPLAIIPQHKNMLIAEDAKKFPGRGVMLKQSDINKLKRVLWKK